VVAGEGGSGGGSGSGSKHYKKAAHPPQGDQAVGGSEPVTGEHVSGWFKQLKEGAIEYFVPPKMTWNQQSTVSVVIHGYAAAKTTQLPEPTGTGTLKVSDRMKVQLLCPENPDEFLIEKEPGTDDVKFVPMDSTTTWRWQVTPKYPRKAQKLTIQAWVLYPGDEEKIAEELPVYTAMLDVDASLVSNAQRGFWNDPANWVKYMLPGGAGFIFLAGIVAWVVKRFKGDKSPPKSP
jgi:hypothetical protein